MALPWVESTSARLGATLTAVGTVVLQSGIEFFDKSISWIMTTIA